MKNITWDTNFNGKMGCGHFVHIDLAPQKMPSRKELEEARFTIHAKDQSHQPVQVQVEAIIPFRLAELSNIHSWPSHGVDAAQLIETMHLRNPVTKDTRIAVYYYKKVNC